MSHDADYAPVEGLGSRSTAAVLRLTLDRPAKRNALDDTMVAGMVDALDAAGRDERVRAIVLAGNGGHFCGGADIVARNAPAEARPATSPGGPGSGASSGGCRRWPTG